MTVGRETRTQRPAAQSNCRIALQQGLQANEGVVQRGQDHFAIRTCNNRMQAATRVIAALRPLQALATKAKALLQALAQLRLVSIHAVQH